jgi:hypothetical protein
VNYINFHQLLFLLNLDNILKVVKTFNIFYKPWGDFIEKMKTSSGFFHSYCPISVHIQLIHTNLSCYLAEYEENLVGAVRPVYRILKHHH